VGYRKLYPVTRNSRLARPRVDGVGLPRSPNWTCSCTGIRSRTRFNTRSAARRLFLKDTTEIALHSANAKSTLRHNLPSARRASVFATLKRIGWRHDRAHHNMKRDGRPTIHSPFTISEGLGPCRPDENLKKTGLSTRTSDGAAKDSSSRVSDVRLSAIPSPNWK